MGHTHAVMEWPASVPSGFETVNDGFEWDPKRHLALSDPAEVMTMDFSTVQYPTENDYDLAFTAPFRVFSDEGVSAMRSIISRHMSKAKPTPRATSVLRGLGFWSKFVRDFHLDGQVVDHLSKLANRELLPHSFIMNMGHCNIGQAGNALDVDKWHFDSVDYVLVMI